MLPVAMLCVALKSLLLLSVVQADRLALTVSTEQDRVTTSVCSQQPCFSQAGRFTNALSDSSSATGICQYELNDICNTDQRVRLAIGIQARSAGS